MEGERELEKTCFRYAVLFFHEELFSGSVSWLTTQLTDRPSHPEGTMALTVFIIDYSGGTAGESHPVPFFQIQQVQGSVYRPCCQSTFTKLFRRTKPNKKNPNLISNDYFL